ncbi:hypothetical protein [Segatella copri]|uniref:hypothetical protein n=1 Tax=Segatella copri TaxID=165179 RepID=UPI001D17B1F0|nr:hypothetical protein [Segatella copri]
MVALVERTISPLSISFAFVTYSSAGASLFKSSSLLHEEASIVKDAKNISVKLFIQLIRKQDKEDVA